MAGRTSYTPTPAAYDPQVHMDAIYAHFDALTGETRANAAALPVSGNWVGRTIMAEDTKVVWICTALPGTWKPIAPLTNLQLDTSNSLVQTVTQVGQGRILGTGAAFVSEAITFPVAFTSTPTVVVTSQGQGTGGFSSAGLPIGALYAVASNKSLTGFTAGIMAPTGTVPSGTNWYYDWIAVGTVA